MKRYEKPSIEVSKFEVEEIIMSTIPIEDSENTDGFGDINSGYPDDFPF